MISALDVIVAVAALIGAGLGVFNFLRDRAKEKVRLRVIPKAVMLHEGAMIQSDSRVIPGMQLSDQIAIEVVNLSAFPVEVDNVGFLLKRTARRLTVYDPAHHTGEPWPRKLQPREKVILHGDLRSLLRSKDAARVVSAFAETSCGHLEKGKSKALQALLSLRGDEENA